MYAGWEVEMEVSRPIGSYQELLSHITLQLGPYKGTAQGESSGRRWGTGQGGEKRGRVSGVLSAPSPLSAQEDM